MPGFGGDEGNDALNRLEGNTTTATDDKISGQLCGNHNSLLPYFGIATVLLPALTL
jgi:hypothetical protein